jgi:hypothetical protein
MAGPFFWIRPAPDIRRYGLPDQPAPVLKKEIKQRPRKLVDGQLRDGSMDQKAPAAAANQDGQDNTKS